ncbi:MAG: hypothetical protein H6755_06605 [Candidatus Omnitrophica bacterium]|nr:hypothetical protein [Candidatus Omnitrophota bacterium]
MKFYIKAPSLLFFLFSLLFVYPSLTYAQTAAEEAREQIELERERRKEELEEMRRLQEKPKTAEEVLDMLKKRAEERRAEKRRRELLQTRISTGFTYQVETNPTSAVQGSAKDDFAFEETLNLNWTPKFTPNLSGNAGFSLINFDYDNNKTLSTRDYTISGDITYRLLNGKLAITPGTSYQWLIYPKAEDSSYEQSKYFLQFTHYFTSKWNWGGKYEYTSKDYDHDLARNSSQTDIKDLIRNDTRHTGELWIKRFIGKYSIKVKGKSYRNKSNDEYQDFNDYDAHKGEITLSAGFLEQNKLYLSYTTDFEVKQYFARVAASTARWDQALSHRLSANYTLNKYSKLNYTFTHKKSSSNAGTGNFEDFTNKMGFTLNF